MKELPSVQQLPVVGNPTLHNWLRKSSWHDMAHEEHCSLDVPTVIHKLLQQRHRPRCQTRQHKTRKHAFFSGVCLDTSQQRR